MDKIYNQYSVETIEALAKIVKENDLGEICLTDGVKSITIKGKKVIAPPPHPAQHMSPFMNMPTMLSVPQTQTDDMSVVSPASASVIGGNVVKSPIVGTFYASSAPDKPPFVTVGQSVKKGDVLMIIESMKLMNEVQSEFDGVVQEIFVKNGDAVEFDQPIMNIK